MKNVNFLLLAVTVCALFLESSTAPAQPSKIGPKVQISDEDDQAINQAIESSEAALDRVQKVVADAIRKATGAEKLTLVEATVWLKSLAGISAVLHKQIRDAIASGYVAAIKAIRVEIAAAIEVTQATMDGFNKKPLPPKVKKSMNKEVNTEINNASFVSETFQKYL